MTIELKHALERLAIRRFAVRGQHSQLDRQVEQRTEPSHDIVARQVLALLLPGWCRRLHPLPTDRRDALRVLQVRHEDVAEETVVQEIGMWPM